ncbi:RNA polymerase sigma-70 factor (ECF subfamily) [Silvibacterium bohemicum]|uniref:RNA polymerase sigma factor n=1 Tax=Silvibacterium bohemicum TaxID=1577686 RepID=A0A841K4W0_9BACT|nr:RNA polymerase sigma-70 factor (ECF subfamily) [Silvibacterium bohemicum]
MTLIGFSPRGMVHLGPSPARDDCSSVGFEELALPLFDSLYHFARWLAQNQSDAEDLVQETYLKALRGFKSFEPGTNFRAWIFQILRNTFLGSCTKLERRMTVMLSSEEDIPPIFATPESLFLRYSEIDAVRCAIEQLPAKFREIILLCDVEDLSYREIAEILSIPMGTVMSRLAKARKTLRESLRSTRCTPTSADLPHPGPHLKKRNTLASRDAGERQLFRTSSDETFEAAEREPLIAVPTCCG